jgi:tripartite-type tricarboxylate transporter receptor subunit TctC
VEDFRRAPDVTSTSRQAIWQIEKIAVGSNVIWKGPNMRTLAIALRTLLLIAPAVLLVGPARAQPYPIRPIKMIVPFAPGGADVIARLLADRISASLGQPVIIENRPGGAGGTVGTLAVAQAQPDGYTLTLASPGPITVAPAINKSLEYDPITSFAPVSMFATSPFVLVINPGIPAHSVQELIVYAKNNPGRINFVTPGFGTFSHLFGELLKLKTGADLVHVPYRGSAPAIVDLVAGQVQMYFDNLRNLQPFIRSGKLRGLAVTSEARDPDAPELPTMLESGIDGFVGLYWNAVLAPAGTPPDVIDRLNRAINDGLKTPEMQASLARLGMVPKGSSPQELGMFIAAEIQKWTEVVRAAKLRTE